MTVEELIQKLKRAVDLGRVDAEAEVHFRDYRISDEAMEAGSNGYAAVEEVLITPDGVKFLDGGY